MFVQDMPLSKKEKNNIFGTYPQQTESGCKSADTEIYLTGCFMYDSTVNKDNEEQ